MNVDEAMRQLARAFPTSKTPSDTLVLYREKLGELKPEELERAVTVAIEKCTYFPKLSELLAYGRRRDVGKGSRHKQHEWDAANIAYATALRDGPEDDRRRAVLRNSARFEAIRRVEGNPVMSSAFAGCVCSNEKHPHSLDEALAMCGLDWKGDPIGERKPWEIGRDVRPDRGGEV